MKTTPYHTNVWHFQNIFPVASNFDYLHMVARPNVEKKHGQHEALYALTITHKNVSEKYV